MYYFETTLLLVDTCCLVSRTVFVTMKMKNKKIKNAIPGCPLMSLNDINVLSVADMTIVTSSDF